MKFNKTNCLFYIFVILMTFFIAYYPAFGVIDDHDLTNTLLLGKNIPFFVMPNIGRFFPLNGQELNVLSFIFSPSPQVFYLFNALMLLVVVYCSSSAFYLLLNPFFKQAKNISYLLVSLIMLSPAFLTSWLRLFVPERMEFVFLSIFFHSYLVLCKQKTQYRFFVACICVLASLIALFYKETTFILLGSFAFLHILFCLKEQKQVFKIDFWILLNCVIWGISYFYFVLLQKNGDTLYGDSPYNRFLIFLKDLMNYLCNDPILLVMVTIILCLRFYDFFFKKEKFMPIFDSMLFSSFFFVASYVYLGISNLHYLLPAYLFALPACCYYVKIYFKNFFMKCSAIVVLVILLLNCLPLSIYYAIHYKFVPQNFQSTLRFLSSFAQENPNRQLRIYLEGVNRASGIEVYVSFQKWMEYYGVKNFDFYSDISIDHRFLGKSDPNSLYSVFKTNDIITKRVGDLVILTPYTGLMTTDEEIEKMKKSYKLLYASDQGLDIPLLGFRTLVKWIGIHVTKDRKDFSFSHNIFGLPISFYVFEVR